MPLPGERPGHRPGRLAASIPLMKHDPGFPDGACIIGLMRLVFSDIALFKR